MALQNDNFNDNALDLTFWSKLEDAGGAVAEANQQLECTGGAAGHAGVTTNNSHDLTTADIQVDVNNVNADSQQLYVCLTKVTAADPYWQANWYRIMKYNVTNRYYVQRRVGGGGVTTLATGFWSAANGFLRITIAGGTIKFFEEEVEKHSEGYALGSYTAYVVLNAKFIVEYLGMDAFDNFLGSSGEAPTLSIPRMMII